MLTLPYKFQEEDVPIIIPLNKKKFENETDDDYLLEKIKEYNELSEITPVLDIHSSKEIQNLHINYLKNIIKLQNEFIIRLIEERKSKIKKVITYYDNKNIISNISYYDDKNMKQGESLTYNKKGILTRKCYYKNNQLHGKDIQMSITWYPNEDNYICVECNYLYGKKHGEKKTYYKNGDLIDIEHYDNNIPIKYKKSWNKNGILTYEVKYEEDKHIEIYYHPRNKIAHMKRIYHNNQNIEEFTYYENGSKKSICNYYGTSVGEHSRKGKQIYYGRNGIVTHEYTK
jgi:antitoxin component YwqK of YwqJK toxin-antitoxin module